MAINVVGVIDQNEVTINTDYYFKVSLYNEAYNTDYEPDSATVKFLDSSGSTILDTVTATVTDNDITYTLDSEYTGTAQLFNIAHISITKSTSVYSLSFIFHVVKQIIVSPVLESDITGRYEILSKQKLASGWCNKIKNAFEMVKNDLRGKRGAEYVLGLIDNTQIKELVILKTIIIIAMDLAAGQGDDGYMWRLMQETKAEYSKQLETGYMVYDNTAVEDHPNREQTWSISSYR